MDDCKDEARDNAEEGGPEVVYESEGRDSTSATCIDNEREGTTSSGARVPLVTLSTEVTVDPPFSADGSLKTLEESRPLPLASFSSGNPAGLSSEGAIKERLREGGQDSTLRSKSQGS